MGRNLKYLQEEEGDAWLKRNRKELGWRDPVGELMDFVQLKPNSVLEIGCANGWRMKKLEQRHQCAVWGLDVSKDAVAEAKAAGLNVIQGTADKLPFMDKSVHVVIWGFFFYLAEPPDYFKIVAETDRVLMEGGWLIIHDFVTARPFRLIYPFGPKIWTYRFDPQDLFLGHPAYKRIAEKIFSSFESASLLHKDTASAFPAVEVEN